MPFPSSPSVGDTFTNANGTTFTWTSHGTWDAIGGSGLPANANGYLRNDGTGVLSWDTSIGNWTSTSRPTSPSLGDMGYNVTLNRIEYWSGSSWDPVGAGVSAGSTVPTNAQRGDLWFNTTNEILYTYINGDTGDIWLDISSPSGSGVLQWTNATRPISPNAGVIGFNTDLNALEVWNGTSWGGVGSGMWTTASRPATPTTGQVGYNNDSGSLEYWNGSAWQVVGGSSVTASATAPTTPNLGDMWFNTSNDILFVRVNDGANDLWLDVSTIGAGGGSSVNVSASATAPTTPNLGDMWFNTSNDILFVRVNDGANDLWLDVSTIGAGGGSSVNVSASATAPTTPNLGDMWFNTSTGILFVRVNDGANDVWLDVSSGGGGTGGNVVASATAPISPNLGDMWFNTSTGILFVRVNDGANDVWLDVSSGGGGTGGNVVASATAPTSPNLGDMWFNTSNDILFVRVNDGANDLWLDVSSVSGGGTGVTVVASATAPASPNLGDIWFDTVNEILLIRANDGANDIWLDVSSVSGGGTGVTVVASATAPASPNLGDMWFDTSIEVLLIRVNDGANDIWLDVSSVGGGGAGANVSASATAPTSPNLGDMWFDTSNEILLIRVNDGASDVWLDVSSIGGGGSTTPLSWTTATRPATPTVGTTGFNTSLGLSEVWDGTAWIAIRGNVTTSASAPSSPNIGDMWFDTSFEVLLIRVNDGANDVWLDVSSLGGGSVPTYTTSATAPATPRIGDEWYDTGSNILYKRVNDGTTDIWLQIS